MHTQIIYKANNQFAVNNNHYFYYQNNEDQFFCCRAVWRAVIMQAVLDLTNNSARTEEKLAKTQAKSWILDGSIDFLYVCQLAEYDYKFIQKKARIIIDNYEKNPKKMRFFYAKLKKIYNNIDKDNVDADEILANIVEKKIPKSKKTKTIRQRKKFKTIK